MLKDHPYCPPREGQAEDDSDEQREHGMHLQRSSYPRSNVDRDHEIHGKPNPQRQARESLLVPNAPVSPALGHTGSLTRLKTTVARVLASRSNAPVVELDALWWKQSWTPAYLDDFRSAVEAVAEIPAWVIEGNYLTEVACDTVWPRADTLVWLDPPRRVAVSRVLRRTQGRVVRRDDLWGTNRQGMSSLTPRSVAGLIRRWDGYFLRVAAALEGNAYPALTVVRLRDDREVADWLGSVN